jgi:hypothetical protein
VTVLDPPGPEAPPEPVVPVLVPVFCVPPVPGPELDPVLEMPLVPPGVMGEFDFTGPVVPGPVLTGDDGECPVLCVAGEPPWVDVVCPGFLGPTGWWAGDGDVSAKARAATSAATPTITRVSRVLRRHREGACDSGSGGWESLTTTVESTAGIRPFVS